MLPTSFEENERMALSIVASAGVAYHQPKRNAPEKRAGVFSCLRGIGIWHCEALGKPTSEHSFTERRGRYTTKGELSHSYSSLYTLHYRKTSVNIQYFLLIMLHTIPPVIYSFGNMIVNYF